MNIKGYGYKDHYCYEESGVLKNKFNIQDQDTLDAVERRFFVERSSSLPKEVDASVDGFLALHHHLFQDIYSWSGQIRDLDISKGSTRFCLPQFVEPQLKERIKKLQSDGLVQARDRVAFSNALAEHVVELNMIHPFREGNGRTLRAFLYRYCATQKQPLDLTRVRSKDWMDACIRGVRGDTQHMAEVLLRAFDRVDQKTSQNSQRRRQKQR